MHSIDWKILERLRTGFLTGAQDYWRNESDVENYDQTFAQRIGWKWDYALRELKRRGWSPPAGDVLDWGCGTGIASRKVLEHFPGSARRLYLCDRSPLAMKFAARQVRGVDVWQESVPPRSVDLLLISHALTEQAEPFSLPCEAQAVIIVEPGTYDVSRRLIALRERLRGEFQVVAPCPHQAACGLRAAENERHWCHQFAPTPAEVFMDGDWARFAKLAGIDLRSLPVSYLTLDRRVVATGATQAIGRARVYKAHALVLTCDETGVRELRVTKRENPDLFRRLKKTRLTL
ncbi:MAG: hypothetical protein FJ395_06365 [Verrucomicrobia bacterium]|nr:hypothetical protein [Verrucomicrobiota bacterium]